MEGYLLEFPDGSPFYNNTLFVVCDGIGEFKDKMQEQFSSEVIVTMYDDMDAHLDGEISVGVTNSYEFMISSVGNVIK